jgi:hypothetical protein
MSLPTLAHDIAKKIPLISRALYGLKKVTDHVCDKMKFRNFEYYCPCRLLQATKIQTPLKKEKQNV